MKNEPQAPESPWAGDDERPICDNGTMGKTSYQLGQPSGNSFPSIPDPYQSAPDADSSGSGEEISDFGLNETVEVGHNQSIANYGVEGPAAGGGLSRNTKT